MYRGDGQPGGQVLVGEFAWTYDAAGRLVQEAFNDAADQIDYTTAYQFDLTGNRLLKTVDRPGSTEPQADERTTYAYDVNDRLLEETLDLLAGDDTRTEVGRGRFGDAADGQDGGSPDSWSGYRKKSVLNCCVCVLATSTVGNA